MRSVGRSSCWPLIAGCLIVLMGCVEPDDVEDKRRPSVLSATSLSDGGESFRLQAVSFGLEDDSVWLSGTGGVYVVGNQSSDAASWPISRFQERHLEFRDVQAITARRAVLLASGAGPDSRIYLTDDGGASWELTWQGDPVVTGTDEDEAEGTLGPAVFLDCLGFWDRDRGLVYGDAIDGKLFMLRTADGGRSWERLETAPPAGAGEGGFAASGDCVQVGGRGWAAVVTGAGPVARLLISEDYGQTWSDSALPIAAGATAGAFAVAAPGTGSNGPLFVALGDLSSVDSRERNVVRSDDRGRTWQAMGRLPFNGAAYGLAASVPNRSGGASGSELLVVVGPNGVARSLDGGETFHSWTDASHWSVAFSEPGKGLMVGPEGRVTEFTLLPTS